MLPVEKQIPNYDAMLQDGTDYYYGFADFGCTGLTDPKWAILKMEKVTVSGNEFFVRKWAYGLKEAKNLQMSKCKEYSYKFLK